MSSTAAVASDQSNELQPEATEGAPRDTGADAASAAETVDLPQQVSGLKKKLEDAVDELARLQNNVVAQQQLEQLLKQGRMHLQDLRVRLQQMTGERDRFAMALDEAKTARQRDVEQLQAQLADAKQDIEDREAAHRRFAEERTAERQTLERLLAEATANQRDLVQELDEQRQQVQTLREAAIRAQSLAREIMRAHESLPINIEASSSTD